MAPVKRTNILDEIADPSGLTDADWAEINKLKKALDTGGIKALTAAVDELSNDVERCARVIGAFFPEAFRETIKDVLAEKGMTEDDFRELVRKFEGHGSKH
jgi:hypothetical protein